MNYRLTFIFCLLLSLAAKAEWVAVDNGSSARSADTKLISSDLNSTVLEFTVPGFDVEKLNINGKQYGILKVEGGFSKAKAGFPDLPSISRDILVPEGSKATLKIVGVETAEIPMLEPISSRGVIYRNQDPKNIPYVFGSAYQQRGAYQTPMAKVGESFKMRSATGVNVEISPFAYDFARKVLTVAKKVQVEVSYARKNQLGILSNKTLPVGFEELYARHFLNYSQLMQNQRFPIAKDNGKITILAPKAWTSALGDFVAWKNERGFDVQVKDIESISPKTYQGIKTMIADEYKKGLTYLLLVGDAEFIPTHPGKDSGANGAEADPMYTQVDGNDDYPDFFVSRISVKNTTELQTALNKFINYEKNPEVNADWYSKGVGIASDQGDWSGLIDYQRADLLRDMMLKWHYKNVDKIYDPSASSAMVTTSVNGGVGYINYIGHGSENSWGTSGFNTSHVVKLTNGNKLPFIVSVACVNGHFAGSFDTLAEVWVKAGSPTQSKGAIAFLGSSINQAWVEPTVGQKKITELLTTETLNSIGSLYLTGSAAILEANMEASKETFETWHIFGDASLQVRTKAPEEISATAKLLRNRDIEVDVKEKNIAVTAYVNGIRVAKAVSDTSGIAKLTIPEGTERQAVNLVMTGFNKIPQRQVIQ